MFWFYFWYFRFYVLFWFECALISEVDFLFFQSQIFSSIVTWSIPIKYLVKYGIHMKSAAIHMPDTVSWHLLLFFLSVYIFSVTFWEKSCHNTVQFNGQDENNIQVDISSMEASFWQSYCNKGKRALCTIMCLKSKLEINLQLHFLTMLSFISSSLTHFFNDSKENGRKKNPDEFKL